MDRQHKKAWILVSLGAIAVGAIAAVAWAHRDELRHRKEPYPWPEPQPTPFEERLASQKVTLNLDGTPLTEALELMHDLTSLDVGMSPALKAKAANLKVTLRVRDISVANALNLILATSPEPAVYDTRAGRLDLCFADELPPKPRTISVQDLIREAGGWRDEYRKKLASQKLTFNFNATPLSEIVQFLQDFTGLNITVAKSIDQEAIKIDLKVRDVVAGDALAQILPKGLRWELRNESLEITDEPLDATPSLARRHVALDVRGKTVPDLIAALAKQGVEAVATEAAWASAGTLSVAGTGELETVLAPLRSGTSLSVDFVGKDSLGREVVFFQGKVLHENEVLEGPVPAAYAGVVAEVARRRRDLAPFLATRASRREDGATGAALDEAETRAYGQILALDLIIQRSRSFAEIPERRTLAAKELEKATASGDKRAVNRAKRELQWIEKGVPAAMALETGKALEDADVETSLYLKSYDAVNSKRD
jgi:hypothetical protein